MMEINGPTRLRFGDYEVDLHTHELWKHGIKVKLVGQPFEILAALVRRSGQLVTREELRTELWPADTFVDFNHGLNAAVNKLRDALCDSADDPKYIETLPRRGYRFMVSVEGIEKNLAVSASPALTTQQALSAADLSTLQPVSSDASSASSAESVPAPQLTRATPSRMRWVGYALFVVALFLGLRHLVNYLQSDQAKRAAEAAPSSTLTPLTTLTDRTSQPAFSPDGTHVAFRRESFVPGNSGIWVKQIAGEELIQLTSSATDFNPVWSPDGRSIAFSRLTNDRRTIAEISAGRVEARNLFSTNLVPGHSEIDWSPDGRSIAFCANGKEGVPSIFLLSLDDGSAHQITMPVQNDEDWGPVFSPDGSRIAFVRSQNIMVMASEGGEVRRLTPDSMSILGAPTWAADGQSIIFAAQLHADRSSLWRVPISGGKPSLVRVTGEGVLNPAAARRGFRLAFEFSGSERSINQMDLYPPGQKPRALVTSVSGENAGQQISPDGTKLAFESDRTGGSDIWVSDRNGQNPIQLTAMGTAGSPRWSPDGKEIVFDVGLGRDWREPRAIYLVSANGETPHPLVQDSFSNNVPSWSHDGEWIYFASNRADAIWQIWKIRKTGGQPIQVTTYGGFASIESSDGQYLYYAKHNLDHPEIWRVPVAGGTTLNYPPPVAETPVFPGIRPLDWGAWTLVENGILFIENGNDGNPTVSIYDFSKQGIRKLAALDQEAPFWLAATKDGKSVIFDQPGQQESHIMLLENFR